jgi:hypothetical protein
VYRRWAEQTEGSFVKQRSSPRRIYARRKGAIIAATAIAFISAGVPAISRACDLCAIYSATELRVSRTGLRLGMAEQFTSYNTLQRDGEEVANPAGEWLNSTITQFVAGYNFTPRLGLQVNVPLISRYFRRQEAAGIVHGDETGIGDLSLLANYEAYSDVTENGVVRLNLIGGFKLPSGNSHRLKEELAEPDGAAAFDQVPERFQLGFGIHHGSEGDTEPPSGIHGHDLALGSGSLDGVFGAQLFWSWQRLFLQSAIQYVVRTQGSFEYQYADDLMWNGGPGAFVLISHDYTVGLQAVLSGESKGKDTLAGVPADDTAITALYAGPGLLFTWGTSLGAELAGDIPVVQNNSALQIVPDYRVRGGFTWRF